MVYVCNDVALLGQFSGEPRHLRHAFARAMAKNDQRKSTVTRGGIFVAVKPIHQRVLCDQISLASDFRGILNVHIERLVAMQNSEWHGGETNLCFVDLAGRCRDQLSRAKEKCYAADQSCCGVGEYPCVGHLFVHSFRGCDGS